VEKDHKAISKILVGLVDINLIALKIILVNRSMFTLSVLIHKSNVQPLKAKFTIMASELLRL